MVERLGALDSYMIKSDFDYDRVKALSSEAREKLKKIKPEIIKYQSPLKNPQASNTVNCLYVQSN